MAMQRQQSDSHVPNDEKVKYIKWYINAIISTFMCHFGIFVELIGLVKIHLVEYFFTGDLIKSEVFKCHCLAGMIEEFHDEANVIVCLNVDAVGAGFSHCVGAKIVQTKQVASFGHYFVKLLLGNMSGRVSR